MEYTQRMNAHGYEFPFCGWISYLGMIPHIYTTYMGEQQQIYAGIPREGTLLEWNIH